jgi:hypothetical protein
MTIQARLRSGDNYFLFDGSMGWKVLNSFRPPSAEYTAQIATGVSSPDYGGGELEARFPHDVTLSLPLRYGGQTYTATQARRRLSAFLSRELAYGRLQVQIRNDYAFDFEPLWGQWGAWQSYEVISTGDVMVGEGFATGDRNGWAFATVEMVVKPAILGQPQEIGDAMGSVVENWGADGLSKGVTIPASSQLVLPAAAIDGTVGTVVVAWESGGNPGGISALNIFNNGEVSIYWDAINSKWTAFCNNVPVAGSATTFPAAGTLCVFHLDYTLGTNAAKAYLNGVQFANPTSVAFAEAPTYIGTNTSGGAPIGGIFRLFSTYDSAMTAAEVAADYTDIVNALAAGPSPSPIPYLISRDGTGRLENCIDSVGPNQNYGWLAGIPGSLPAKMELRIEPSTLGDNIKRVAVSLLDYEAVFDPAADILYNEGTGTADASSSGGQYLSTTIDTTFTVEGQTEQDDAVYRRLQGREVAIYSRLQSGATGGFQIKLVHSAGTSIVSIAKNVATATAFRLVRTLFMTVPPQSMPEIADEAVSTIQLYAGRTSGSGTALFDFFLVMPRPLVEINTSGLGMIGIAIYEGSANRYGVGIDVAWANIPRTGDVLRPLPHRYNLLMLIAGDETVNPTIVWNFQTEITITPRWGCV